MAYYNSINRNDDEDEQNQQTVPSMGVTQRTSDTGTMVNPSATPNSSMQQSGGGGAPTRSPMRFVNLQRFLEQNPLIDTSKSIGKVAGDVNEGEQKRYDTSTAGTRNFIGAGHSFSTPVSDPTAFQNNLWGLIPNAPPNVPLGDKIVRDPNLNNIIKSSDSAQKIKSYLTDDSASIPTYVSWMPDNAAQQKFEMMKTPNKIGPNSLARQLVGNQSTNYGTGMEALDSAMFNQSPDVKAAIDAAQKMYTDSSGARAKGVSDINSTLKSYRDTDKLQQQLSNDYLTGKFDDAVKNKVFLNDPTQKALYQNPALAKSLGYDPSQLSDELYKYQYLAGIIDRNPNDLRKAPTKDEIYEKSHNESTAENPSPAGAYNAAVAAPIEKAKAEAADAQELKQWQNLPEGLKKKKKDLEDWQPGRY